MKVPMDTPDDYKKALKRIEKIFQAQPGSKDKQELENLVLLLKKYEDKFSEKLADIDQEE